jgi:hypothetical protein
MTGQTIDLDVFESTTIADIKYRLAMERGWNLDTVSLIANGKKLVDTDEVIVNTGGTAYIYSAKSHSQLNLLCNSIGIYLVNKTSSLNPNPGESNITSLAVISDNSISSLLQRNKFSLIIAGASIIGATAIVLAVLFPPTGMVIGGTLAISFLITAACLAIIAGIVLFKICLSEQYQNLPETNDMNDLSPPLPSGWHSSRYLMIDHGGVLDGEIYEGDIGLLNENDLVLNEISPDLSMVLKNGVIILRQLSDLVTHHHFRLVFHSKNHEDDQQRVWQQIKDAVTAKKIQLPPLFAMVVYDTEQYQKHPPVLPSVIINDEGVKVIGYGQDEGDGKSCVRQALSSACAIDIRDRKNCFVFDDGASVIDAARNEGYHGHLIGSGPNACTLAVAVDDLHTKLLAPVRDTKRVMQQPGKFSVFELLSQGAQKVGSLVVGNQFQ